MEWSIVPSFTTDAYDALHTMHYIVHTRYGYHNPAREVKSTACAASFPLSHPKDVGGGGRCQGFSSLPCSFTRSLPPHPPRSIPHGREKQPTSLDSQMGSRCDPTGSCR